MKIMIIYLDLVIISTILVNILIIEGIESIFRERLRIIRVIISSLLSVALLGLYLLPIGKITWIRYLLGIPIALTAFPKGKLTKVIMQVVFYYLLHLALIGTLEIFNIRSLSFLIISTILVIGMGIITAFRANEDLEVKIGKKIYRAIYDSGNASYYLHVPVIYLDLKYYSNEYHQIGEMVVNHLHGSSLIAVYQGPELFVNHHKILVYYAFTTLDEYDLILHKDIGGNRCLNY